MRTISILMFTVVLTSVAFAQDRPATRADLYTDYTAGHRADYSIGRCDLLISDFESLPHQRDNGVPLSAVKDGIDETITAQLPHPDIDAESESDARYRWRRVIAATPKDMADWNAVIEKLYNSEITEKQIDKALRKYCTPHTKHVFRASDFTNLVSKSQHKEPHQSSANGLSATANALGESVYEADYEVQRCSVVIYELSVIPAWRDGGLAVPFARAKETLVEVVVGDPTDGIPMTQAGLDAWRSVVASTPQDIADWNAAVESIYHSKVTEKQIDKTLRKYCTPHTKHVFRASDLTALLQKHQK